MQSLRSLRQSLTADQRDLLNEIWKKFLTKYEWPIAWEFHSPNRKRFIRNTLNSLNNSIVFEASDSQHGSRYQLKLLGILLTNDGPDIQKMLSEYLEFCRKRYQTEAKNRDVKAEEVQAELGLNDDQTKLMGVVIIVGHFYSRGAGYDTDWKTKHWHAGVIDDVEDFPPEGNLDEEVERIALRRLDFSGPVFLDQQRNDPFVLSSPLLPGIHQVKEEKSKSTNKYLGAWSVVRSVLHEKFTFATIKTLVGYAGVDSTRLAHLEQKSGGKSASKSELLSAIDTQVAEMDEQHLAQFLRITIEETLRHQPALESNFRGYLERLGWTLHEGDLLEISVVDLSELPEVPSDAHDDLVKASKRLRDGDLTGAVSAACAAVDSVTAKIYQAKNLGDPGKASFQERVAQSLKALNIISEIERQLVELAWDARDAKLLAENVRGSLNQAAFVLQTLRSKMGDVHGSKPILKPLVFDSIKWAMLVLRLLV